MGALLAHPARSPRAGDQSPRFPAHGFSHPPNLNSVPQLDLRGNFPGQQDHQKQKHPWKTTSPGRILGGETLLLPLNPRKNQETSLFQSQPAVLFVQRWLPVAVAANFGLLGSPAQLVGFDSSTEGRQGGTSIRCLSKRWKRLERPQGLKGLPATAEDPGFSPSLHTHTQPAAICNPGPEDRHILPPWPPVHTWHMYTHEIK